ncbi:HPr family phosphocarrier protein [Aestuariibacter salexigens]|uniref:HPr family phosphocarrier protein n=1 Tax=Aestuariibacter salexigens TaxID=226010 RepID=UPI00041C8128|nr:HPr family phosphocarrier protein [Aestuariibacter salexigens]
MALQQTITIINKLGLHARAATQLVQLANQFDADITLQLGDKSASANSVLGIMMLEGNQGKDITVVTDGKDAKPAMQAVVELVTARFNEAE